MAGQDGQHIPPAPQSAHAAANIHGILAMVAAGAAFSCGDTLMKVLAGSAPTSELIFIRGLFVFLGALVACLYVDAFSAIHRIVSPAMAIRAIGDTGGAWSFQLALARMPYADLSAITQLSPLSITAVSALIFAEKVGWRRWTATAIGFMGVMLIIKPGSSTFNWWALMGLGSVLASTVRDLATRRVSFGVPPPLITLVSAGLTTLTSLVAALFEVWVWPSWGLVGGLFAAAMFSLLGQQCTIFALRSGEISAVVPFRYSIIIFAILSGIVVFGQIPDAQTLLGILIVCSAGLYTFYREQQIRRRARQGKAG